MLTLISAVSVVVFAGLVNRLEEPNKKNLKQLLNSLSNKEEIMANRQLIFVKGYLVDSIKVKKNGYQLQLLIKELEIKNPKTKISKINAFDFYGLFDTKFLPQKPVLGDEIRLTGYGNFFFSSNNQFLSKILIGKRHYLNC